MLAGQPLALCKPLAATTRPPMGWWGPHRRMLARRGPALTRRRVPCQPLAASTTWRGAVRWMSACRRVVLTNGCGCQRVASHRMVLTQQRRLASLGASTRGRCWQRPPMVLQGALWWTSACCRVWLACKWGSAVCQPVAAFGNRPRVFCHLDHFCAPKSYHQFGPSLDLLEWKKLHHRCQWGPLRLVPPLRDLLKMMTRFH